MARTVPAEAREHLRTARGNEPFRRWRCSRQRFCLQPYWPLFRSGRFGRGVGRLRI